MDLGRLDDEFKKCGMQFEDLEMSGDKPIYDLSLCCPCILMDSQYVYSTGKRYINQLMAHRLDLRTRKWELLHKSCDEC